MSIDSKQVKNRAEPGDLVTTRETNLVEETYFCKGNRKHFNKWMDKIQQEVGIYMKKAMDIYSPPNKE